MNLEKNIEGVLAKKKLWGIFLNSKPMATTFILVNLSV